MPCDAGDVRIFVNVELDTETGLYYYGARYLDPKYSRWLSGDPAVGEYISIAGEDNAKLPAAGKTVGAVAVSIGPVDWVVIGVTVVGVGVGIALYNHYANSADKENEQAKAVAKEEGNRSFGSITIQIQKGTKSIQKGSTRLALNEKGVTKQEAQYALHEQVDIL